MKCIFILGRDEETGEIQRILQSVNAASRLFPYLEAMIEEARKNQPHLFIIAFESSVKTENTMQQIKKESGMNSVPLLAYYPSFTTAPESRGRAAGASDVLKFPVTRHDLLSRTATLLNVGKRKTFKTLLTIEKENGHSVMATSEDFSEAGVSFVSEELFNEKDKIRIQFFLPGNGRVGIPAAIMRMTPLSGKYFYGARFLEMETGLSEKIRNFIDGVK